MGAQSKVNAVRRQQAHALLMEAQERAEADQREMVERAADIYNAVRNRVDQPTRDAMAERVNKDGTIAGIFDLYEAFIRSGDKPSQTNLSGQVIGERRVTKIQSNQGV